MSALIKIKTAESFHSYSRFLFLVTCLIFSKINNQYTNTTFKTSYSLIQWTLTLYFKIDFYVYLFIDWTPDITIFLAHCVYKCTVYLVVNWLTVIYRIYFVFVSNIVSIFIRYFYNQIYNFIELEMQNGISSYQCNYGIIC